jgi:hypothetical protein
MFEINLNFKISNPYSQVIHNQTFDTLWFFNAHRVLLLYNI